MEYKISGTYTDLYQLAMGQAYFADGLHNLSASFDYFFRKIPFQGGYVVFAGLADVLDALESIEFTQKDITFLAEQGFRQDYLNLLKDFKFTGTIHAPLEGEIIFPTEPVLRVEGTMLEVQLAESLLLNILNFESLIATKAARIRSVAGDGVLSEFGLRRAQGTGAIFAARAAIIGGFDSTSNVYAAKKYNLPCEGTMAHSFIQLYEEELTAFRKFAVSHPDRSVFLVDTYDTLKSGLPNAIKVAKEMETQGHRLRGIRLDSGDLSFFAGKARKMLDKAGLSYVKIAASNQLDEYVIRSLHQQNAPIDIFGVGTSLVTGQPDAALDGVYKLVAVEGQPRIKVSENLKKITLPGQKQVLRLLDSSGQFLGMDAIVQKDESLPDQLIHPFNIHKRFRCKEIKTFPLLQPVMKKGKRLQERKEVTAIKEYSFQRLSLLPEEYKRFENPHIYKVGISPKTQEIRQSLRKKHQGKTRNHPL